MDIKQDAPATSRPTDDAEAISVFDIFKIGVGPSSSHTMGPWVAARRFLEALSSEEELEHVARVQVVLYGSLAKTGRGHGTDKALQLGLMDEDYERIDPGAIDAILDRIQEEGRLHLGGEHAVPFDPEDDIVYRRDETLSYHANGMTFRAQLATDTWREKTYYSVGGGFVVSDAEVEVNGAARDREDDVELPYPCATGAELQEHCHATGLSISELVRRNEHAWHDDEAIDAGLHRIWEVMKTCAYRGCHAEGELPGGLQVARRAGRINRKLLAPHIEGDGWPYRDADGWIATIRRVSDSFEDILKWVSCFAIAVNEENAAFGRVVTAPTNGAAGVVPAVLLYYACFRDGSEDDVPRFLLTAGQIGSLFKQRATISAAMGGCQAEIGVSSAMASAALTECLGGDVDQVLMAAEIAMEHHLGMTCDPVGGLVQVPCIERNSMGAVKAITASNIALESDPAQAKVSLDTVITSMWETARDMNDKYKETSEGGLAANIPVNVTEC